MRRHPFPFVFAAVCIIAFVILISLHPRRPVTWDIDTGKPVEVEVNGVTFEIVEKPKGSLGYIPKEGVPYVSGPNIKTQDYRPGMNITHCWWQDYPSYPFCCQSEINPKMCFSKHLLDGIQRLVVQQSAGSGE